jgi:hypothetical protein
MSVQGNLIKYYEKTTDMALKNLEAEKTFQFKKMLTNHSLLKVVESHYESITKSDEAKKKIKQYMTAMNSMTAIAKKDYNITLSKLKATKDPILKQKILDDYADKGISGFIAKNGAVWSIESYSNMYTTHFNNELVRLSVIETIKPGGRVQVSESEKPCPLCIPYENKILTLEELEEAKAAGLFHVRCKHFVSEVI